MPSEKYKQLLLEHAGLSKAWESLYTNNYTINDLDHEEINKTIQLAIKVERIPDDEYTEDLKEILIHFDLIENDKLTNAAMVLFAKKMPADFSQCFMRLGRFVDETMDEAIDSKQIRGNAFQLLAEAQDFVSGTGRIIRLCAEQNLPQPTFSEETDGFVIRFFFKEPISSPTYKFPLSAPPALTARELEIIQILVTGEHLSLREIVGRLKSPPASRTVGDDLSHLKELNLVNSKGTGRGAKWFIVNQSQKNGADNGADNNRPIKNYSNIKQVVGEKI